MVHDGIVAFGEATGHHHRIEDGLVTQDIADLDKKFVEIEKEHALFVHQEHGEIKVPQGYYKAVRQREYTGVKTAPGYVAD